jgi:hypothetical protein
MLRVKQDANIDPNLRTAHTEYQSHLHLQHSVSINKVSVTDSRWSNPSIWRDGVSLRVDIVPWWRYLLRNNGLSHSVFTLFICFRLHRRYYTIVELELANSRTVDSRSLELSTLELWYPLTDYSLRLTRRILRLSVVFFDTVLLPYPSLFLPPKFLP